MNTQSLRASCRRAEVEFKDSKKETATLAGDRLPGGGNNHIRPMGAEAVSETKPDQQQFKQQIATYSLYNRRNPTEIFGSLSNLLPL